MGWDGTERRSDDVNGRVASLEAHSDMQAQTLRELKADLKTLCRGVEDIRRDIHSAKVAGRMTLGVAMTLGGLVGWILQLVLNNR